MMLLFDWLFLVVVVVVAIARTLSGGLYDRSVMGL
jgi:hypothetical protein